MRAYWFRFMNSNYIGLAVAESMKELFWAIDEYSNPNTPANTFTIR